MVGSGKAHQSLAQPYFYGPLWCLGWCGAYPCLMGIKGDLGKLSCSSFYLYCDAKMTLWPPFSLCRAVIKQFSSRVKDKWNQLCFQYYSSIMLTQLPSLSEPQTGEIRTRILLVFLTCQPFLLLVF